jgi:GTP diphosphokinase / guanosine-3',5'-bis(diphosphate) 3'-diphosphatase
MRKSSDPVKIILKAAQFAAHKHKDQRRKDAHASPYINHPIELANVLRQEGLVEDPQVIAAALLHDTIEDTETSYGELRGQFGVQIAEMVAEVTDTKWLEKRSRKRLQISKSARASHGARLVKLADKICNVRDIIASAPEGWSMARKREYFDWAKSVVDQIRGTNARLERRFDQLYRQRP